MTKQRATKHIRIYPKTHEMLRRLAFKRRVSLTEVIDELVRIA